MNAITVKSFRATLGAALVLSIAPNADAADAKVTQGAECQPYSTTTIPSEISFRANGLKNISANAEYVVCNVMVDTDNPGTWNDANPATVTVTFHSVTAGTARCELYVGSNLDGSPVSYVQQVAFSPGQVGNISFSGASGQAAVQSFMATYPVSLFCRLPPNSSILRIRLVESVVTTDGPVI
jgi:hypothetical protein